MKVFILVLAVISLMSARIVVSSNDGEDIANASVVKFTDDAYIYAKYAKKHHKRYRSKRLKIDKKTAKQYKRHVIK